ncbi:MAG: hypothetical protein ACR2MD_02780 [Aridibacter sp.]
MADLLKRVKREDKQISLRDDGKKGKLDKEELVKRDLLKKRRNFLNEVDQIDYILRVKFNTESLG